MAYSIHFGTVNFDGLHIKHVEYDTITRYARFSLKVLNCPQNTRRDQLCIYK